VATPFSSISTARRRALTVALFIALTPVPVMAQGGSQGPLGITPGITWRTHYDDNVYRNGEHAESDLVSTIGARAGVRRQIRRLGVSLSGGADWVHFDRLASERGANVDTGLRLDVRLNRFAPYVSTSYRNSRERLNPEIDTRPRIGRAAMAMGSAFRLGGAKTSLDLSYRRSMDVYNRSATVDGVRLADALNRASNSFGVQVRRELTPLTRINVRADLERDRFDTSSRSANNLRLSTGFDSDGLINGSAQVGVRILKPQDPGRPESRRFFVSLGTGFTVRDRVQIGLDAHRDFAPSYTQAAAYYAAYSYGMSLSYAMLRVVRLSAQVDRRVADYRASSGAVGAIGNRVDEEMRYGAGIGYSLGRSIGVNVSGTYSERTSTAALREFDGLSVGAGISYGF
jgi:hypothetical protein